MMYTGNAYSSDSNDLACMFVTDHFSHCILMNGRSTCANQCPAEQGDEAWEFDTGQYSMENSFKGFLFPVKANVR